MCRSPFVLLCHPSLMLPSSRSALALGQVLLAYWVWSSGKCIHLCTAFFCGLVASLEAFFFFFLEISYLLVLVSSPEVMIFILSGLLCLLLSTLVLHLALKCTCCQGKNSSNLIIVFVTKAKGLGPRRWNSSLMKTRGLHTYNIDWKASKQGLMEI